MAFAADDPRNPGNREADQPDRLGEKNACADPNPGVDAGPSEGEHFRDYRKGAKVGEYTLEEKLGEGSFAYVWKARDPNGEAVAIKVPFKPADADATVAELLALTRMSRLKHEHLLETKKFWNEGGRLFIVMELADGGNLRGRLKQVQNLSQTGGSGVLSVGIPIDELLGYFRGTADALDFLRGRGIRHRDVKPANILLVHGKAKLADFGLAKKVELERSIDETFGGTPAYMAPEMIEEGVHEHSDQYCFAVAYVELRQGRLPFRGIKRDNPDLRGLSLLEKEILGRALANDPRDRFPSCREFVNQLEGVVKAAAELTHGVPKPHIRVREVMAVPSLPSAAPEPPTDQPPQSDTGHVVPNDADDVTDVPDGTDKKAKAAPAAPVDAGPEAVVGRAPPPEPVQLDSPETEHGSILMRRPKSKPSEAKAAEIRAEPPPLEKKPDTIRAPKVPRPVGSNTPLPATVRQRQTADWRRDATDRSRPAPHMTSAATATPRTGSRRSYLKMAVLVLALGTLAVGGFLGFSSSDRTRTEEVSEGSAKPAPSSTVAVERTTIEPKKPETNVVARPAASEQAVTRIRDLEVRLNKHNTAGDLTLGDFEGYKQELIGTGNQLTAGADDELNAAKDALERAALSAARTRLNFELARAAYDWPGARRAEAEKILDDGVPKQAADRLRAGKVADAVQLLSANSRILDAKPGAARAADRLFSAEADRLWNQKEYDSFERLVASWQDVKKRHEKLTRKDLHGYDLMAQVAGLDRAASFASLSKVYDALRLPAEYSQYQASVNALFRERAAPLLKQLEDGVGRLPRTGTFKQDFLVADGQKAYRWLKLVRDIASSLKDQSLTLPVAREVDLVLAAGQQNDRKLVLALAPGLVGRPKEVGSAMYPLLLTLANAQEDSIDRLQTFGHFLDQVDPKDLAKVQETAFIKDVLDPGIKLGEKIARDHRSDEGRRLLARLFVARGDRQVSEPAKALDSYENACKYDKKPDYLERLKGSVSKAAELAATEAVQALPSDVNRAGTLALECRNYWHRLAKFDIRDATEENRKALKKLLDKTSLLDAPESKGYDLVCRLVPSERGALSSFDIPVLVKKMYYALLLPEYLNENLVAEGKRIVELARAAGQGGDAYWLFREWEALSFAGEVESVLLEKKKLPALEAKARRRQLVKQFTEAATVRGISPSMKLIANFQLGKEYYFLWRDFDKKDTDRTNALEALEKCKADVRRLGAEKEKLYEEMIKELNRPADNNTSRLETPTPVRRVFEPAGFCRSVNLPIPLPSPTPLFFARLRDRALEYRLELMPS